MNGLKIWKIILNNQIIELVLLRQNTKNIEMNFTSIDSFALFAYYRTILTNQKKRKLFFLKYSQRDRKPSILIWRNGQNLYKTKNAVDGSFLFFIKGET